LTRSALATLLAGAVALQARSAHAYDMGWYTPPGAEGAQSDTVPITIRATTTPLLVDLYPGEARVGEGPPIARCEAPCQAHLPRGRYRLYVHETASTESGSRVITIADASTLEVDPRSSSQRGQGLALGIGGILMVAGGIVLLLASGPLYCVDTCKPTPVRHPDYAIDGLMLLIAGSAVSPIGWVVFGKSFRPAVDVLPSGTTQGRAVLPGSPERPLTFGFKVAF
jgi:hypothetical protein